jgi:hypothetical protein
MLRVLLLAFAAFGISPGYPLRPAPPHLATRSGQAPDTALTVLKSAPGLRCVFDSGTSSFFDRRGRRVLSDRLTAPLVFDQIDHTARHARVVDSEGGSDVSLLDRSDGITFVEAKPLGVSLYTIFAVYTRRGEFRAVMSSHMSAPQPVSQTLFGSCRVAS